MVKKYNKSLFIFRRDLRLEDNIGLIQALNNSETVITCFIFDPRQVSSENEYKSNNAIQFMIESLVDLQKQLEENNGKLEIYHGNPESIVQALIKSSKFEAVFINRDYTPFSSKRDREIERICHKNNVDFIEVDDFIFFNPYTILTQQNSPFTIFTPFYKRAMKDKIPEVQKNSYKNYSGQKIVLNENITIEQAKKKFLNKINSALWVNGGRNNAIKILKKLSIFINYTHDRDYPSKMTTNLSAHLKFGTISPREFYFEVKKQLGEFHPLNRQIFWREFYTYVAYHSPFVFGYSYKQKYENLKWNYDKKLFKAWCEGKTGFPIVDAGMRQLNETGFMHNRIRMITASFLVKDLHIDWRWGEKYFAQKLVDYDPCVNNGNWQWIASTGSDCQPYFRIFNPWLQQKKFDYKCQYIKKWVHELGNSEPKVIHSLISKKIKGYPSPIVDHAKESKIAILMFR